MTIPVSYHLTRNRVVDLDKSHAERLRAEILSLDEKIKRLAFAKEARQNALRRVVLSAESPTPQSHGCPTKPRSKVPA